jgi:uncharacterized membrane protein YfcA
LSSFIPETVLLTALGATVLRQRHVTAGVAATVLGRFVAHLGQAKLDWAVVIPFTLMATLGSVIGSALARHAQPALLRRGFAGFVCLVAVGIVVGVLPQR